MRIAIAFALLAGIVLTTSNGLLSQDKKDPPKVKGSLPQNWSKLDLSAEQKAAIYKVRAKFKSEIDKLEAMKRELQAEERQELIKVLTADQKKKLQEITLGEKPKDSAKPKDTPKPKDGTSKTDN